MTVRSLMLIVISELNSSDITMAVQIETYRYVGGEDDGGTLDEHSPSSRQFELYVIDGRPRAEGKKEENFPSLILISSQRITSGSTHSWLETSGRLPWLISTLNIS